MANKLTKKQKGFVKDYVETDNATQAIINNHPNVVDRIVAKSMGSENLTKPYIIEAVKELKKTLADAIPDDLVTEKHIALLNKTEKKFNQSGELISEEIDTQAVKAGVDMALKLKGAYAPEKKDITLEDKTEATERIKLLAEKLKGL
jgi:phage terminase small subunit